MTIGLGRALLLLFMTANLFGNESSDFLKLANEYKKNKNYPQALAYYKKSIHAGPTNIDAYIDMADFFAEQSAYDTAAFLAEQSVPHIRDNVQAFRVATSLFLHGKIEQAIKIFETISHINPLATSALYNIGYANKVMGNIDTALEYYEKILQIEPQNDSASFALGMALLNKGDFDRGWKQHELYLKRAKKNADKLREFIKTNSVAGKKIYICPEGGFGDMLMCLRYVETLKQRGATTIVSAKKGLLPLLQRCPYIDILIPHGTVPPPYHDFVTDLTLPAVFNADEKTIPQNIPYIFPDENLVQKWRDFLAQKKSFNVGICWQADVFNDSSRAPIARRGIPLQALFKLGSIKNVQFYSLQKCDGLDQLSNVPASFPLHVFDEQFDVADGPLMDTAALMKSLDLVISVDTAIAHLAGALGTPVWLMLPYSTDWRWIVNRTDTPWYPTMRIFKQPKPFDWPTVVDIMYHALESLMQSHA